MLTLGAVLEAQKKVSVEYRLNETLYGKTQYMSIYRREFHSTCAKMAFPQ